MGRANTALTAARSVGADRLAGSMLADAESTLVHTSREYVRQEGRLLPFRNFTVAANGFAAAESLAVLARSAAVDSAGAERADAEAAVRDAEATVAQADACGEALRREGRAHYRRARLLLGEAQSLLAAGSPIKARTAAFDAMEEAARACRQAAEVASRFIDAESVETWRRWMDETIAESRAGGGTAIVVVKERNELRLYAKGKLVKSYLADMGLNSMGTKLRAGDRATPEGRYRIVKKKGRGASRYFMALLLDYPNDADRERFRRAKERGLVPRSATLGGDIEIHGEGGRGDDWTRGCIALSNADIRDLSDRVAAGTPVTIVGGDGDGGVYSSLARRIAEIDREKRRR